MLYANAMSTPSASLLSRSACSQVHQLIHCCNELYLYSRTSLMLFSIDHDDTEWWLCKYESRDSHVSIRFRSDLVNSNSRCWGRMVIWYMKWRCVVPLCILMVAHWAVLLQSLYPPFFSHLGRFSISLTVPFVIQASWQTGVGCVQPVTTSAVLKPFISTVAFDTIVLGLTAFKLGLNRGGSRLGNMLFRDGLIYFTVM